MADDDYGMNDPTDAAAPPLLTARTQIRDYPFKAYCLQDQLANTAFHAHDYLQIWYVRSGSCRHQIADRSARLKGGSIFVLPPFVPHRVSTARGEPVEIIGCEFTAGFLNADLPERFTSSPLFDYAYLEPFLMPAGEVNPGLPLDPAACEAMEVIFQELLLDYRSKPAYFQLSIKANVLKLLARLARLLGETNPGQIRRQDRKNRDSLAAALAYIHQNYSREIYNRDLCSISLMSRTAFAAAFRHLTGQTPVDYINCLRIQKAQALLADRSLNMTDICFQAGFNDVSYFARVFRKVTGRSPRAYREQLAE